MTRELPAGSGQGRWPNSAARLARDRQGAELRIEGKSWQHIADELGYASQGHAHQRVNAFLSKIPAENVAELRRIENVRLEQLRGGLIRILKRHHVVITVSGRVARHDVTGEEIVDDEPALKAFAQLLRVNEAVRKLNGLDAPIVVEHTGKIVFEMVGVDPDDLS